MQGSHEKCPDWTILTQPWWSKTLGEALVFQVFSLLIGTMEVMLEEDRRMLHLLIVHI